MPELIITADDCGLSPGINQTVFDLHQRGYISAASVMTNFPAQQHALELFRAADALDIGAHLTLTDGFPLSRRGGAQPQLLRGDGRFRNKFNLYLRGQFLGSATLDWIRQELDAQLRRFSDASLRLQHISTHHHFQTIPSLRRIVHELAADYGVDWVRGHDFRASLSPSHPLLRAQRKDDRYRFAMPDYMIAIQAVMSQPVEDFCQAVMGLEGTLEIVVHPSPAADPDFPAGVEYDTAARLAEAEYLIKVVDRLRLLGAGL